jgi:predicted  nucleic acid-binding Zn-ribbon protein
MCVQLTMSGNTNKLDSANSVSQFFNALASEVKSKKIDLELRRVRKVKERKRLQQKGRKQRERLEKLAMEFRATESNLQAVNHEIEMLDVEIVQAIDTDYD